MSTDFKLSCWLFDLMAPWWTPRRICFCLNKALSRHGFMTVTADTIKPFISFGAAAMIDESRINLYRKRLRQIFWKPCSIFIKTILPNTQPFQRHVRYA